jgi:protocatechuate 4,5-dioxygenase, alpha chain
MGVHERFKETIPGTVMFDGQMALKGYALNAMCYSFNEEKNRKEFLADEEAFCTKFGLNAEQKKAIKDRDVLALIAAGGNIYYLAKFGGIFGLNMQDVGAQQTHMSVEAFAEMLQKAGE